MDALDKFVDQKLKGSFYQIGAFIILFLINVFNGAFMHITIVIDRHLTTYFGMSPLQLKIVKSIYFVGVIFGSQIIGFMLKIRGRAFLIKCFFLFQIMNGILQIFVKNYYLLLYFWFAHGIFNGFCLNLLNSFASEIVPIESRGRWMIIYSSGTSFGKLIMAIMSYLSFNETVIDDWMYQIFFFTCIAISFYPFLFLFLRESLRFLYVSKRYDQFTEEINKIIHFSNAFKRPGNLIKSVTKDDVKELEQSNIEANKNNANSSGGYKYLLSKTFMATNIKIWIIWFTMFINVIGQANLTGKWFSGGSGGGLGSIITSVAGEIPSMVLVYNLIDRKTVGRKTLLNVFSFFTGVIFLIAFFVAEGNDDLMKYIFFMTRFGIKGVFGVMVSFTAELYPTIIRSNALGICASLGGFASCILPFILDEIFAIKRTLPFPFFAACCFATFISSMMFPFDTTGKSLDSNFENKTVKEETKGPSSNSPTESSQKTLTSEKPITSIKTCDGLTVSSVPRKYSFKK